MSRILIVIPARGGSTRVPRKNMQVVGGMTLVERAVRCGEAAGRPIGCGQVVVSTDDYEIAATAEDWGPAMVCLRPQQLRGDGPMWPVLADAHRWMRGIAQTTWDPEWVACLQPTSPLRTHIDVRAAILMACDREARSLVSVNEQTGQRNGAIYITRVEMLRDGLVFDADSLKYPMPAARSLDINTPEDLEEARRILGGTT